MTLTPITLRYLAEEGDLWNWGRCAWFAIVDGLCHILGQPLGLKSNVGRGSTFLVTEGFGTHDIREAANLFSAPV